MKRVRFGFFLLIFLLAISFWTTWKMATIHKSIAEYLSSAADSASAGNWDSAKKTFFTAKKKWDQNRHFSASVADHEPIEEIEASFAETGVLLSQKSDQFSAECRSLSVLAYAMADSHALTWWNLL